MKIIKCIAFMKDAMSNENSFNYVHVFIMLDIVCLDLFIIVQYQRKNLEVSCNEDNEGTFFLAKGRQLMSPQLY